MAQTSSRPFDRLGLLEPLVDVAAFQIVISSSWRFHFTQAEILARLPPQIARQVQGVTGDAHVGRYARWHEIGRAHV